MMLAFWIVKTPKNLILAFFPEGSSGLSQNEQTDWVLQLLFLAAFHISHKDKDALDFLQKKH